MAEPEDPFPPIRIDGTELHPTTESQVVQIAGHPHALSDQLVNNAGGQRVRDRLSPSLREDVVLKISVLGRDKQQPTLGMSDHIPDLRTLVERSARSRDITVIAHV